MTAIVPQGKDGVVSPPRDVGSRGAGDVARHALGLCAGAAALFVAMIGVGLLLTHAFSHTALIRADERISLHLATHRTAGWTSLTWWATQAAESFTVVILGVVGVILLRITTKRWRSSVFLAASILGEASIYLLITLVVHRHRPLVHHLDAAPPTSSFPSGHVAASVALYGSLAVLAWVLHRGVFVRWSLTAFAFVVPVAVACSRVYRGMHYPTDVCAGALLGTCWLWWVTTMVRPAQDEVT